MPKINVKVRQARLNYQAKVGRDISIAEVAKEVGITRAALSKVERGEAWPSREVLAKLCAYYGLSVAELLEYEDRLALQLATA